MSTIRFLSFFLTATLLAMPSMAQDSFTPIVDDGRPPVVVLDHVGADLRTPAKAGDAGRFSRIVEIGPDGLYLVRIRSAQHIQRMEGSYLDSDLSVPHGRFIYYHPNGRIESVGVYDHGVKVGTWYAQDITGQGRVERSYAGLGYEDLLVAVGAQQRARTITQR